MRLLLPSLAIYASLAVAVPTQQKTKSISRRQIDLGGDFGGGDFGGSDFGFGSPTDLGGSSDLGGLGGLGGSGSTTGGSGDLGTTPDSGVLGDLTSSPPAGGDSGTFNLPNNPSDLAIGDTIIPTLPAPDIPAPTLTDVIPDIPAGSSGSSGASSPGAGSSGAGSSGSASSGSGSSGSSGVGSSGASSSSGSGSSGSGSKPPSSNNGDITPKDIFNGVTSIVGQLINKPSNPKPAPPQNPVTAPAKSQSPAPTLTGPPASPSTSSSCISPICQTLCANPTINGGLGGADGCKALCVALIPCTNASTPTSPKQPATSRPTISQGAGNSTSSGQIISPSSTSGQIKSTTTNVTS